MRPAAPPPPPPPTESRPPSARARASFDRVLPWAIGVSVGFHLILLLLSPLVIRIGVQPGLMDTAAPTVDAADRALQGVVPIPTPGAPETLALDPVRDPSAPAAPPSETTPRDRGAEAPGERRRPVRSTEPTARAERSAREALRPGYRDPRLYVNPRELRLEAEESPEIAYREHLRARFHALNDSLYADQGPNTDWTTRDAKGRRWGVSEEGVHLGGVTIPRALIPLPGATGTNQTLDEARERNRQRDEIRRQEDERAAREARERRARELRRDSVRSGEEPPGDASVEDYLLR